MHILHGLSLVLLPSLALAQFGPGGGPRGPGGPGNQPPAHTITTATGFGVVSALGAASGFDSVATGTAVNRALRVAAGAGARPDAAHASTHVAFARSLREGPGVEITEHGRVANAVATQNGSAGTSADAPGTASPTQGAHGIQVAYPNLASGTNAIVSIHWSGRATAGASISANVDINGDGTADFTGGAARGVTQLLQATAGANGVVIDITTSGAASVTGAGKESYEGRLVVLVKEGTLPTSCTFTNFGAACGADLNGTVGTGLDLTLDVTNAPANAMGFFVAGDQAATPSPLPGGTCNLLVDGRRWFHHQLIRTDATGTASVGIPTPRLAVTIAFQALLFTPGSTPQTRNVVASNGTELVCQ
jgi:hypothetical protein